MKADGDLCTAPVKPPSTKFCGIHRPKGLCVAVKADGYPCNARLKTPGTKFCGNHTSQAKKPRAKPKAKGGTRKG